MRRVMIVGAALALAAAAQIGTNAANVSVSVDYSRPKQALDGFGASITWVSNDLSKFSAAKQAQILELLYDSSKPGAALSWMRAGTFLCDYNPSPGVYNWNHWGISTAMQWMQRVIATYGVDRYMVSTWSPPAWMKSNNSCINGGSVLSQRYPDLAAVKIQWLQTAQSTLGVAPRFESPQNEPDHRASYESAEWTPAQLASFTAGHLAPALAASGLTTQIMAPESSYYSNFDNAWGFPLLNDAAMRAATSVVATHGYGRTDNFSNPCNSCTQYGKPIWQTEDSNLDGKYNGSIDEGLTWSTEIYKAVGAGQFSAWFYWWVMTLQNDNQGLLNVDPATDSVQVPKRLYVVGHFSRFMRPGSTVLTATSSDSSLQATAVRPTTGSVALVLANPGRTAHSVTVTLSGAGQLPAALTPYRTSATENQAQLGAVTVSNGTFTITVPAKSIVTLVG